MVKGRIATPNPAFYDLMIFNPESLEQIKSFYSHRLTLIYTDSFYPARNCFSIVCLSVATVFLDLL